MTFDAFFESNGITAKGLKILRASNNYTVEGKDTGEPIAFMKLPKAVDKSDFLSLSYNLFKKLTEAVASTPKGEKFKIHDFLSEEAEASYDEEYGWGLCCASHCEVWLEID